MASRTVLGVASFGAFLAFLDATVVNVAFPSIRESFPDASISNLSWVLNAYNIVFAAFLVPSGRLADLLGRKKAFGWGVLLFTGASLACALAPSIGFLVAARMAQALGAAVLVPASLALVVQAFPAEHRTHAVGLWGASAALASGLGPPIGGLLVQWGDWRWAFLVNLPFGIVAWFAARRGLVESRSPGRRRMPDLLGAGMMALRPRAGHAGAGPGQRLGLGERGGPGRNRCGRARVRRLRLELAPPPVATARSRAAAGPPVRRGQRRDGLRGDGLLRLPADEHPLADLRLAVQRASGRSRAGARGAGRCGRRRRAGAGRGTYRVPPLHRSWRAHLGVRLCLVRDARGHDARLPRRVAARPGAQRRRRGHDPAAARQRGPRGRAGWPLRHRIRAGDQLASGRWRARHRRAGHDPRRGRGRDRGRTAGRLVDVRRLLRGDRRDRPAARSGPARRRDRDGPGRRPHRRARTGGHRRAAGADPRRDAPLQHAAARRASFPRRCRAHRSGAGRRVAAPGGRRGRRQRLRGDQRAARGDRRRQGRPRAGRGRRGR